MIMMMVIDDDVNDNDNDDNGEQEEEEGEEREEEEKEVVFMKAKKKSPPPPSSLPLTPFPSGVEKSEWRKKERERMLKGRKSCGRIKTRFGLVCVYIRFITRGSQALRPPVRQDAGGGARTRDRRVPADFRVD
ncbi:hypothetical protein PoB_000487500 [Plakobranchus ocellatus]|uniref:Uncharacterized protein n=1 Tax=Plakobranchus ocellatus TaxID=259542 RepID=A0AAV3Y7B3_9GAST|nr:hypothetical protein PoB_000487500 [Plakobranchus ocellatus]